MINPMKLMRFREMGERFKANHPRVPAFFEAAMRSVDEGSIIEMSVTDPQGKKICANIRVTAEDMAMIREAQDAFSSDMR